VARRAPSPRPSLPSPPSNSEAEDESIIRDDRIFSAINKVNSPDSAVRGLASPEDSPTFCPGNSEGFPTEARSEEDLSEAVFHDREHVECVAPTVLTTPDEERPLQFGDLVVARYQGRKKIWKWPAIVLSFHNYVE
jgi:hypothetical protein